MGGMFLSNIVTVLDYETLFIQKNSEYALHIPEQNMKKLIYFYVRSNCVYAPNTTIKSNSERVLELFKRKT